VKVGKSVSTCGPRGTGVVEGDLLRGGDDLGLASFFGGKETEIVANGGGFGSAERKPDGVDDGGGTATSCVRIFERGGPRDVIYFEFEDDATNVIDVAHPEVVVDEDGGGPPSGCETGEGVERCDDDGLKYAVLYVRGFATFFGTIQEFLCEEGDRFTASGRGLKGEGSAMIVSGWIQGVEKAMEFVLFFVGEREGGREPFLEGQSPVSGSGSDGAVWGLSRCREFFVEDVFDERLDVVDVYPECDFEHVGYDVRGEIDLVETDVARDGIRVEDGVFYDESCLGSLWTERKDASD